MAWKGVVAGACNAILFAALLVQFDGSTRFGEAIRQFWFVCFVAMLPAIGSGYLQARVAGRLTSWRRLVLVATATAIATLFVVMSRPPALLPVFACSLPTTIVSALLIERWLRPTAREAPLSPPWRGVLVAAANVGVVAVATAVWVAFVPIPYNRLLREALSDDVPAVNTISIVFVALVPGLVIGALLGWFAGKFVERSTSTRVAIIAAPAVASVAVLIAAVGVESLMIPATLPTFASALVLERWTRRVPRLPLARAIER